MNRSTPRLLEDVTGPVREIPTPEGVPLRFGLALAGDRAGAFLIDALLIIIAVIGLMFAVTALAFVDEEAAMSIFLVSIFALRNCYFSGLEILWRGRTVGKRIVGLQVIDRTGQALRVEAIFARNLTRELEVFLPLTVLAAGDALFPGLPPWGRLFSLVWALFFALFPLFNRDRLRIGDLVAGTLVVKSPRRALLPDLADRRSPQSKTVPRGEFAFSRKHLESYGIYELQVLEKVLRERNTPPATLRKVADQIAEKIGWTAPVGRPRPFLAEFYRAQRAHLENRMLLGDRREDKEAVARRQSSSGSDRP